MHKTWFKIAVMLTLMPISVNAQQAQYRIIGQSNNSASCHIASSWCIPKNTYRLANYVKNEILLMHDVALPDAKVEALMQRYNLRARNIDQLDSINLKLLTATTGGRDPFVLMQSINRDQQDVEAGINTLFYVSASSGSRVSSGNEANINAYPFNLTGISAAYPFTKGKGVVIGMIDTPIDINNSNFHTNRIRSVDQVRSSNAKSRQHGTEVAGVMISSNERVGIAPEAILFAVSAFGGQSTGERSSNARLVAKALELCIKEKVDVLNLSFAGGRDALVEKLVKKAMSQGTVVVASAGNGGPAAAPAYPAAIPGVLAVTAIDDSRKIFTRANRGSYVDIAAPGVNIMTIAPGGAFHISSGTSLATAHVSGIIALMKSMNRNFNVDMLKSSALDLGARGKDNDYGYGLVSVPNMVKRLR